MNQKERVDYAKRWIQMVALAVDYPLEDRIADLKEIETYISDGVKALQAAPTPAGKR